MYHRVPMICIPFFLDQHINSRNVIYKKLDARSITTDSVLQELREVLGNPIQLLLTVDGIFGANILYVSPIPSISHHRWNHVLALTLAHKGYNVTYIAPETESTKIENYTDIFMEGVYDVRNKNFDLNARINHGTVRSMYFSYLYSLSYCKSCIQSQGFQKFLNYSQDFKFDLVLFDNTGGGCLYPFIQKFNYPPTVAVTAFLLPPYIAYSFGNHLYPAYVPNYNLQFSQKMTFVQRVWNFIFTYMDVTVKHPRYQTTMNDMMRRAFGENVATIEEIESYIGQLLANTNPVSDYAQPLTSNIVPVGGLHLTPTERLPQDIARILDDAKDGVVLFSLGTNICSDMLSKDAQNALLEAFVQIKQTVIWKFESDIENLPQNVIVRKWLPQNDILGHSNVKLFIGHGGALSTQEAMYHGVPMICIPFFLDQHITSRNVVYKKLGVLLDGTRITTDNVLQQLKEVLENPIFAKNAKQVSKVFRDRPETPLERAVFWVEYAIRHRGGHFFNSPARHLPFYVASGLDVFVFLACIVLITVLLVLAVVRNIVRRFNRRKNQFD